MIVAFLLALVAYLIGSIPFGYLVARWRGVDLFQHGSGNIGATNVARVLGRRLGILVFMLDWAKGALAVFLARAVEAGGAAIWPLSDLPAGTLEVMAGLCAFLGHLFPIYLRFRGGKGVATAAGVVSVMVFWPFLGALFTWVLVLLAFGYVSLASMMAALVLCLVHVTSHASLEEALGDPRSWFCLLAAGLVLVRHRSNLARLVRGEEYRIREGAFSAGTRRVVHVLSVGLWLGSGVTFTLIVAPSVFGRFQAQAERPIAQRADWHPLADAYARRDATIDGPHEQGSRAAGYALGPALGNVLLLHGICVCAALATALPWQGWHPEKRIHRWRCRVLTVALLCVAASWPVADATQAFQVERNAKTYAYLTASAEQVDAARRDMLPARNAFAAWHGVSLLLNLVTLCLAGVALGMAAFLPAHPSPCRPPLADADESLDTKPP